MSIKIDNDKDLAKYQLLRETSQNGSDAIQILSHDKLSNRIYPTDHRENTAWDNIKEVSSKIEEQGIKTVAWQER